MTSEGSDGGGPVVDCREGTIVWVRRRNGSWWPGRILGQHELAASHLLSPRSGTPVKLLGREDASVDWYNLEKSKRVKAFRCGEFDECIERVEACPGIPIKKREKYARREDAILHALELEKQMLEERRLKTGTNFGKESKPLKKEAETGFASRCKVIFEEPQDHGNLSGYIKDEFSFPESNGDIFCDENRKVSQPFSWEAKPHVSPSMARLQNFGIQAASLETNFKERYIVTSSATLGSQIHTFPGSSEEERFNYEKDETKSSDRKTRRSDSGFLEPVSKFYDHQRDIQHGFQSSKEISVTLPFSKYAAPDCSVRGRKELISMKRSRDAEIPTAREPLYDPDYFSDHMHTIPSWVEYPPSLGEQDISSSFIEPDDYNVSERLYLDPDIDEEHTLFPGTTSQSRYCQDDYHTVCVDTGENFISMPLPSAEASTSYHHEPFRSSSSSSGVSRWKLKGKRNDRNFLRKGFFRADGNPNGNVVSMNGKSSKRKRHHSGERSMPHIYRKRMDELDLSEFSEKLEPSLQRHDNHLNSFWLKGYTEPHTDGSMDESDDDSHGLSLPSWEAQMLARPWANPEVSGGCHKFFVGQFPNKVRSRLTDVDIQVQASSRGEHVPLISLMSRLNGKAIVGHPIPVEKLSAGSCDALLYQNHPDEDPASGDGNASPPSAWRTGRRSLMQRVPRLHPTLPMLDGSEEKTLFESKPTAAKGTDAQLSKVKKSSRSKRAMPGKFQMQSLKRLRSSKMKVEDNHDHLQINDENYSSMFGIVKPVETICVTCVPTKVAFSRILEAVRRPPCATSVHETPPELSYG